MQGGREGGSKGGMEGEREVEREREEDRRSGVRIVVWREGESEERGRKEKDNECTHVYVLMTFHVNNSVHRCGIHVAG